MQIGEGNGGGGGKLGGGSIREYMVAFSRPGSPRDNFLPSRDLVKNYPVEAPLNIIVLIY